MPDAPVMVRHTHLETFIVATLMAMKMPRSPAEITAGLMVRTDLRGVDSHGIGMLPRYVQWWREGLTNIAIGLAGFAPLLSYLGERDPAGRPLQATILALADELAGAAEPVMGKLDRIPAAIVRGLTLKPSEEGSKPLLREPARDLFR